MLWFSLFLFLLGTFNANAYSSYQDQQIPSTVHFQDEQPQNDEPLSERRARQYETFDLQPQQSEYESNVASFARGSNFADTFVLKSGRGQVWNSLRRHPNRVTFDPIAIRARSKRMAIERRQYSYGGGNCQYHTLLNGDSEILLRKILPIRLRGRTILRHCIEPPPAPNDPNYRVLLRGNNKSSFGSVRVSMKL